MQGDLPNENTGAERAERLTQREERFCAELVKNNYKKREAAIAAGCPEKSAHVAASKMLKKGKVLERVRELQSELAEQQFLTASRILTELIKTYERALVEGEYTAAIRALEMIGRHIGMFTERHEVAVQGAGQLQSLLDDRRRHGAGDG
jgi:phage terminase small subunit